MKADIQNLKDSTRNMDSYRRPNGFCRQISALDADGKTVVTARFYYPASVAYCVVWVHGDTRHGFGVGKAGGYGYHKESAALAEALSDAGVILSEHISGRGDRAMPEALEAVARAASRRRKFTMFEAHA